MQSKAAEKPNSRIARIAKVLSSPSTPLYERGKILILHILGLLAGAFFAPMGISVVLAGSMVDGAVLFGISLFQWLSVAFLYFSASVSDGARRASLLSAISITIGLIYAVVFGGYRGYGMLYVFLSPIIFFYLLGFRFGAVFTLALSMLIASSMIFPQFPVRSVLELPYLVRILILYILLSAITAAIIYVFRQSQGRLARFAFYDDMTGLPNRYRIRDAINRLLTEGKAGRGAFVVFFISLNKFRHINDNYGYQVGDEVIKLFSRRISALVPEDFLCGRFGGTNFLVALPASRVPDPLAFCEQVHALVAKPFELEELSIPLLTNISYLEYPKVRQSIWEDDGLQAPDWIDADWIFKNLEVALDSLDRKSGGHTVRYDSEGHRAVRKRYLMAEALRLALDRGEISLHYQPIVAAQDRSVRKLEVLARWKSASFGSISPAIFIPMAEDQGLIREISEYLFATAFSHIPRLDEANKQAPLTMSLSLNLSPVSLYSRNFSALFNALMKSHGIPTSRIELEITESLLLKQDPMVMENLNELIKMGVALALDDFGTGYSSLSYLQRFSVSTLKIDRSFIATVKHRESSREIVRAVLAMARSLGISTVAEGVENADQCDFLKQEGCNYLQGYYFAKPMELNRLLPWLESWNSGQNNG